MTQKTLFLFRNDLRLEQNSALRAACESDQPVVLLYIFDEYAIDGDHRTLGSASRWWLHHSLTSLDKEIHDKGGKLILRRGNTLEILREIIDSLDISKLYFSRAYEPGQRKIENDIYDRWHDDIEIKRYGGYLLFEPEQVQSGDGKPYKVFTPFWKACLKLPEPKTIQKTIKGDTKYYKGKFKSDKLSHWSLLPTNPDWSSGLIKSWQPGEKAANKTLREFLNSGLSSYNDDRNRPDIIGTSRLSAHLHFGEIAPAKIWQEVKSYSKNKSIDQNQAMSYLRELGWRDFSTHLLFHWPHITRKNFKKEFASFPWKKNSQALKAWQKGMTGYPIVDAGMRQLWETGWMHNRVRMVVASLLVKHLLISWKDGEEWFWDTLVDADLANNVASWQWVAGSGADAAPYFRIFNPILQGKKFDPDGIYVRQWVPELKTLPNDVIHEPWKADRQLLEKNNIELGKDYPYPIIEHDVGRKQALAALDEFKSI